LSYDPKEKLSLNVEKRDYFKRARANDLWTFQGRSFSVEVVRTLRDSSDLRLILASAIPGECVHQGSNERHISPGKHGARAAVAIVVSPVLSFQEPVVPVGFLFAIVDEKGPVQFHSINGRELSENFFEETNSDRNSQLQAAVSARRGRFLDVSYFGRSERIYIRPMPGTPWSIVVMRDTSLIRCAELEAVWSWLYLALRYSLILSVTVAIARIGTGQWGPLLLWPDREESARYLRASIILGLLVVAAIWGAELKGIGTNEKFAIAASVPLFTVMILYLALNDWKSLRRSQRAVVVTFAFLGLILWVGAVGAVRAVFPFMVIGLALIPFHRWLPLPRGHQIGRGFAETRFRRRYTSTLLMLIVTLGVTPSAMFFLDTMQNEFEGVSRLTELRWFTSMKKRAERVRGELADKSNADELLAARLNNSVDIYVADPWVPRPSALPTASACRMVAKGGTPALVPLADRGSWGLLDLFWDLELGSNPPFTAELREAMRYAAPMQISSWSWLHHYFKVTDPGLLRERCVTSYSADSQPPPVANRESARVTALIGLLLLSLLFLLLKKMATALFLLDADSNPPVSISVAPGKFDDFWTKSSVEERLALRHLADDGFLSSSNSDVVRNLMSRGLIKRSPSLLFVDAGFRKYVLEVPNNVIRDWDMSGQRSGWSELRGPLLTIVLLLIVLLFLTQPDLVLKTTGVITAVAVALPQAASLLKQLSGRGSAKDA
jgi:hypothetical protein